MMKRWLRWSVLSAALALCFASSHAQTMFDDGSLRLRLGAYFPTEDELRDFTNTWFAIGLTYQTAGIPFFGGSATELSADLFTHQTGGSRGAVTALLASQVYEQPIGETDSLLQFRIGIGLFVVDTTGPSENLFGGRVGLTFRFNSTYSVELNYDITDRFGPTGARANGFSLTVGYQF